MKKTRKLTMGLALLLTMGAVSTVNAGTYRCTDSIGTMRPTEVSVAKTTNTKATDATSKVVGQADWLSIFTTDVSTGNRKHEVLTFLEGTRAGADYYSTEPGYAGRSIRLRFACRDFNLTTFPIDVTADYH